MSEDDYKTNLNEETQKYAYEALNENPDKRGEFISKIREWLSTQPHLHAKKGKANIYCFWPPEYVQRLELTYCV